MEFCERQQGVSTHQLKDLLDNALSTELQPTIESPKRTVSVFLCHWNTDAENYPEVDSGTHSLRETFEHHYGFKTEVHELEQAKSGPKNQLTLISRFMPLLYDTSPDPEVPCRCHKGMSRYLNKPQEVELFIFIYVGFAETAADGSCLLRPVGAQPGGQDQDPAKTLPSVNLSAVSRATLDMAPSSVLYLLDCPYDGLSTMDTNKELIAAGSALWTPSFEFTRHLAHHIRRAAHQSRIMNTPLLFSRLANTLSTPPAKANSAAAVDTSQSGGMPFATNRFEPISLAPIDAVRWLEIHPKVERRWQPMDVDSPGFSAEVAVSVPRQDGLATGTVWERWNREGAPPRIRLSLQTEDETQLTLQASVWYCLPKSPLVTLVGVRKVQRESELIALLPRRPRKQKPVYPYNPPEGRMNKKESKSIPDPQKPKIRLNEHTMSNLRALLKDIE
ncbi:hypothetical protein PG996_012303 [Apiospora saccharicola]|uniref:Uncharacterized protein n=1 Tax=Apiospora saccharicola TaxID=335842 RepID=A0ABR1U2S4_9PEZI